MSQTSKAGQGFLCLTDILPHIGPPLLYSVRFSVNQGLLPFGNKYSVFRVWLSDLGVIVLHDLPNQRLHITITILMSFAPAHIITLGIKVDRTCVTKIGLCEAQTDSEPDHSGAVSSHSLRIRFNCWTVGIFLGLSGLPNFARRLSQFHVNIC